MKTDCKCPCACEKTKTKTKTKTKQKRRPKTRRPPTVTQLLVQDKIVIPQNQRRQPEIDYTKLAKALHPFSMERGPNRFNPATIPRAEPAEFQPVEAVPLREMYEDLPEPLSKREKPEQKEESEDEYQSDEEERGHRFDPIPEDNGSGGGGGEGGEELDWFKMTKQQQKMAEASVREYLVSEIRKNASADAENYLQNHRSISNIKVNGLKYMGNTHGIKSQDSNRLIWEKLSAAGVLK